MPPTKFMTGNIFRGHLQDALFNLVTVWSNQSILLTGMLTEAIHTPPHAGQISGYRKCPLYLQQLQTSETKWSSREDGIVQKRAQKS